MTARNRFSFRAHSVQIAARNNPEALKGGDYVQKRPEWVRHSVHNPCTTLVEGTSGKLRGQGKMA